MRINPLNTPFGMADIQEVVPAGPDTLLIPKCEVGEDVVEVERVVSKIEKHGQDRPVFFMPLIETAKGILHAEAIASASDRVVAVCFGAECEGSLGECFSG